MSLAYNSADVFILSSLEDNLPNVMLESLCTGTPVIAFPNSGAEEIIQNGINGIITDEISAISLSKAITTFFNNKSSFNSVNISKEAHSRFSGKKHFKSYLNVYSSLMKNTI
jgi:glycosyltransferase involved in cell wall biosynthesis